MDLPGEPGPEAFRGLFRHRFQHERNVARIHDPEAERLGFGYLRIAPGGLSRQRRKIKGQSELSGPTLNVLQMIG